MTSTPVWTEPVKRTFAMPGCSTRTFVSAPPAVTTFTTPGGRPARRQRSPTASPVSAVAEAGFRTTVLPAARQAAISTNGMPNGKFQGVTTAMTPRGSKRNSALLVREEDLRVVDRPLGEKLAGVAREVAERVGGRHDVHGARLADGLPLLGRDQPGDVVVRAAHLLEEPREVPLPVGDRRLRPGEERLPRRGDGHVDLARAGADHVRERLLRGRVHGREGRARLHVLPVDDRGVREGKRRLQIIAPRVIASFFVRQNATSCWT